MKCVTLELVCYDNDKRDSQDRPAVEAITIRPFTAEAEKKLADLKTRPFGYYDAGDVEWIEKVYNAWEIVKRKIVRYHS